MKNPQAFPQFSFTIDGHPHEPGMTLRDYFAAQSINGLTATFKALGSPSIASLAYDIADAMLAEREK